MSTILEAREISVRAGGKLLLDRISLSLKGGERIAIVGPNGAGKTTLLRALSGELKPHSGALHLKGRPIDTYPARELSLHRAVLSQHVTVAFPFTVAEIVAMGGGNSAGRWLDRMVEEKLAEVDLSAFAGRIITTLSGGEQQRAHLARVLVQLACGENMGGPGVLLLDEPTSSLDLRHQLELFSIAGRSAARGVAVVAVLHDLNLAAVFADRVIVLNNGRVASDGTPEETITERMLADVFKVTGGVCAAPPAGMPYVLPHQMARAG